MVKFDHRDPGTAESEWWSSSHWEAVPELDPTSIRRLIVVAAHPDDETLGAAGLMRRVAMAGGEVLVIVATHGEASHPDSPTHTAQELSERRRVEVRHAVELVAPGATIRHLGLRDGKLKNDSVALRAAIQRAVDQGDVPTTLAVTWRGDGHSDHRIVGEVSAQIARATGVELLEYPIWLWHWSSPTDPTMPWSQLRTLRLGPDEREAKKHAIEIHSSQTAPLSSAAGDETLLSDEFLEHFRRTVEVFVGEPTDSAKGSLSREYFDDFYGDKNDPWGFETRWYEQRKRAITMAALPRARFTRVLEIGCSIGVLTEQLAARSDYLLATDIAERPLMIAQQRMREQSHVEFRHIAAHEQWPAGEFDLVVLSEVGYYLTADALDEMVRHATESLLPGGVLLACHWRHPVKDYPLNGDQVHARIQQERRLERFVHHGEEDFVLELYSPRPARSVARQTGLV